MRSLNAFVEGMHTSQGWGEGEEEACCPQIFFPLIDAFK